MSNLVARTPRVLVLRDRLEIALAYLDGERLKDIASLYETTIDRVMRIARAAGCPPRRPDLSEIAIRARRQRRDRIALQDVSEHTPTNPFGGM